MRISYITLRATLAVASVRALSTNIRSVGVILGRLLRGVVMVISIDQLISGGVEFEISAFSVRGRLIKYQLRLGIKKPISYNIHVNAWG